MSTISTGFMPQISPANFGFTHSLFKLINFTQTYEYENNQKLDVIKRLPK